MEKSQSVQYRTMSNMKKLNSNQYVYPYTPFHDLSDKIFDSIMLTKKTVSTRDVIKLLKTILVEKIKPKGKTPAEMIYRIFIHKSILFGPKKYVSDEKKQWIEKFNYFIEKNMPLQLTILGFPFKIPVPLKTDRTMPDMGEVLALKKLNDLAELIKLVYAPGVKITVVTEGVFGSFNGLTSKEYNKYKSVLNVIINKFSWTKNLALLKLDEMESMDKNFKNRFNEKIKAFEKLYKQKDSDFIKKYEGARESLLRIVNTKNLHLPIEVLMDVYNDSLAEKKVSNDVKRIRKRILKEAHTMLVKYHAYLSVRDDLDFIQRRIPHAITLSVSPKPGRLGIIPINSHTIRLPYHGVVVYNRKKTLFTIEYLIDIQRDNRTYQPVFWSEDKEQKPFFYIRP